MVIRRHVVLGHRVKNSCGKIQQVGIMLSMDDITGRIFLNDHTL